MRGRTPNKRFRGSSQSRDRTHISYVSLAGGFFSTRAFFHTYYGLRATGTEPTAEGCSKPLTRINPSHIHKLTMTLHSGCYTQGKKSSQSPGKREGAPALRAVGGGGGSQGGHPMLAPLCLKGREGDWPTHRTAPTSSQGLGAFERSPGPAPPTLPQGQTGGIRQEQRCPGDHTACSAEPDPVGPSPQPQVPTLSCSDDGHGSRLPAFCVSAPN